MSGVAGAHRSPRTKLPDSEQHQKGQPPVWRAALFGLCPECGAPTLFDGPTKFAPRCRACGLDYSTYNVGDGPAAFLTLIIGAVMVALALTLELTLHPPLWLHLLLWAPLTAGAVVGSLRVAKGALLTVEYRKDAREGRVVEKKDA